MIKLVFSIAIVVTLVAGCNPAPPDENINLDYCIAQAGKTEALLPADSSRIPRSINNGKTEWRFVNYRDWTCGFWPGI
jgi:unsaturated chondroitin disaccharide hydrolase